LIDASLQKGEVFTESALFLDRDRPAWRDAMKRMLVLCLMLIACNGELTAEEASDNIFKACAQAVNIDTVQPYRASLRQGFLKAYKRLYPQDATVPDEAMLTDGAYFRCMNGKLLACFAGANLPCSKIVNARINPGATQFCRQNRNEAIVPMAATGHDALWNYACRSGHAHITGSNWTLDQRGFAKEIWAVMN